MIGTVREGKKKPVPIPWSIRKKKKKRGRRKIEESPVNRTLFGKEGIGPRKEEEQLEIPCQKLEGRRKEEKKSKSLE